MSKIVTFVDKYVRGEVTSEDIYEEIGNWHDTGYKVQLHEYLGLTEEEHCAFVFDDGTLQKTLERYRVAYRRSQFKLIICNPDTDPESRTA